MIRYHGLPITPMSAAAQCLLGRHALVSFATKECSKVAEECADSFVLDNGAFTVWKRGGDVDWRAYYRWAECMLMRPSCSWAIIPDVIDGTDADNDAMLNEWPLGSAHGVPVYHLHEDIGRIRMMADMGYRTVCLGSSGDYSDPNTPKWWRRIDQIMDEICDSDGIPMVKLHGLRMMNPAIVQHVPFASVDSTSVGRNIGIDKHFSGSNSPTDKGQRAWVMAERFDKCPTALRWEGMPKHVGGHHAGLPGMEGF